MAPIRKKKPLHFGEPARRGGSLAVGEIKQFVEASYEPKKGETERIGDYVLDKELSTRKAKVYHDPVHDKTIVANRGTTGTVSDWANNARYLLGDYAKTDRMKQAERVQREAIDKYGKVDTNVGHSQGGIITRELNKKGLTGEVINLNPASKGEKVKKNEFIIKSVMDPVSLLQKQPKKRTTKTRGTLDLLKEHSTDVLDRLNPRRIIGRSVAVYPRVNDGTSPRTGARGLVTNMLTDSDIDAYAEKLKIKDYHGCYIKDELPELDKGFYVINLNGQSHWTCLCKDVDAYGNNSYLYFDSFGFPAPVEVEKKISFDNMADPWGVLGNKVSAKKVDYFSMENQLQDIDHTSCGFYVIAFCKSLSGKKDKIKAYQDFITKFTKDPSKNDVILKKILKI